MKTDTEEARVRWPINKRVKKRVKKEKKTQAQQQKHKKTV